MAKTIKTTFKLRRGTATEWLAANPILNQGEPGFEIDTNKLKIGNGMDRWNKLEYIAGEASEDASGGGAAEIYIGTTAPTGKYKLWINPEGEISEGGMGGTGDYGKETKTTKSKIIGPETEDNWDINMRDDTGVDGYISIQIEPPEDIMTTGEEFSFTFNFNNREPIVFSDVVKETSADGQLIKYIGKVEMLFSEDISLFDGSNYVIALGEEKGEFSMVGMFSLTESDINNLQNIEFKWPSIDYVKLPANALTEGTHIKINQENTQINCTIGEPIGISKWKTFGVCGVSSASTVSKYSNNYLYTLQGSYGDKYLTPYNSTHTFEIASEAYISSPQFYYSSAIARNTNDLVNPNVTDSFYSQTQANQYKIFIDYMTPNGETITIDCKGLGYEDQNTIDEFNSLFNLHNQNLNYFFGRYNTLTPAYNISKGIVPEDENEESFFIIFIFAEKWTNCIPILLTDKELNDSERQIFSDNINQPLYDRISLRSLSDENNLFVNGNDNGLILGYSNIYSGDQNIIFGSSNKFLTYGTKNIIFGENNTINGHYDIIFGYNNSIGGSYNIILEGNNSFSFAYGTITTGLYNTISNTSQAAIFGYSNTFSNCMNIVNVGHDNKLYKVDNIGAIGANLSTFDSPYTTLITGRYNAYLSAYYGSSLFNPGTDIFQVGGGDDQQRLNAFGVRPDCCYRQEYNSNGSFAHTFKIWDDKMKLPSMSSGTTTAELIQALISAGIMEGGNE